MHRTLNDFSPTSCRPDSQVLLTMETETRFDTGLDCFAMAVAAHHQAGGPVIVELLRKLDVDDVGQLTPKQADAFVKLLQQIFLGAVDDALLEDMFADYRETYGFVGGESLDGVPINTTAQRYLLSASEGEVADTLPLSMVDMGAAAMQPVDDDDGRSTKPFPVRSASARCCHRHRFSAQHFCPARYA